MPIAAAALLLSSGAAFAVTAPTVTFSNTPGVLPSYTTATVIQSFTGTPNTAFTSNSAYTISGYGQSVAGNGTDFIRTTQYLRGLTQAQKTQLASQNGTYLEIRGTPTYANNSTESFTLSLNSVTKPIQFLAFAIYNYAAGDSTVLHYQDGTSSGNILAGLTTGFSGEVIVDRGGNSGITNTLFSAFANTAAPGGINGAAVSLNIDQIAAAAPEPATWAMMLIGFGFVGFRLRQRRRSGSTGMVAA